MIVGIALAVVLVVVWALVAFLRSQRDAQPAVHWALVEFAEQSLELGSVVEILGFAGEAARVVFAAERAVAILPIDGEWEASLVGAGDGG